MKAMPTTNAITVPMAHTAPTVVSVGPTVCVSRVLVRGSSASLPDTVNDRPRGRSSGDAAGVVLYYGSLRRSHTGARVTRSGRLLRAEFLLTEPDGSLTRLGGLPGSASPSDLEPLLEQFGFQSMAITWARSRRI